MSLLDVASSMGVLQSQLEDLLAGDVRIEIASKSGVLRSNVQRFIDGDVSLGMAAALGTDHSSAQELRDCIGKDGAIGVVIGLCIGQHSAT
jgi:hypothetical protein